VNFGRGSGGRHSGRLRSKRRLHPRTHRMVPQHRRKRSPGSRMGRGRSQAEDGVGGSPGGEVAVGVGSAGRLRDGGADGAARSEGRRAGMRGRPLPRAWAPSRPCGIEGDEKGGG